MPAPYAFVSLLTSDTYLPGALALAAALKEVHQSSADEQNIQFETVCLVTPETVDVASIKLLRRAFDVVVGVEIIEQNDDKGLRLLGRPDLNHVCTKLHAFRLTEYSKIIFLDADVLPIRPLSHLFTLPHEFAAVPDVGWPDIFNSGVFVATPGVHHFQDLMELLKTRGSWDGGDQGLLNEWRGENWHRLSFTYNTTPTAAYTYAPAYERFGAKISAVHFIGPNKPWNAIPWRGPTSESFQSQILEHREPTPLNQVYNYGSLVDRWFAVYDKYYRSPRTLPPAQFELQRYQSAWDEGSHLGAEALPSQAPTHAGGSLGLEDLKRIALEGVSGTFAGSSDGDRSEGGYRRMPLEGRVDLMRPKREYVAQDEIDDQAQGSGPPPVIVVEAATPPQPPQGFRFETLPTPQPHELPPAPHPGFRSLAPSPSPSPSQGTQPAGDNEQHQQGQQYHLSHGHRHHGSTPSEPFLGFPQHSHDRHVAPAPSPLYLPPSDSDSSFDSPVQYFSQQHLGISSSSAHQRRHAEAGNRPMSSHHLHHRHDFRVSPSGSPGHHSPTTGRRHSPPQAQYHELPPHMHVHVHTQNRHHQEPPRPASPPKVQWNPAIEPPPNDPPLQSAFPTETFFTNAWDQAKAHDAQGVGAPPDHLFQAPPPAPIPHDLIQQGHYRNVTGDGGGHDPVPDRSHVKHVFPWEDKPRPMPARVFPKADELPPDAQYFSSSPNLSPSISSPRTRAVRTPSGSVAHLLSPPGSFPQRIGYANAWDSVPSIQKYASRLAQPPLPARAAGSSTGKLMSWDERTEAGSRDADDEDEGDDEQSDDGGQDPSDGEESGDDPAKGRLRRSGDSTPVRTGTGSPNFLVSRSKYRSRGVQTDPVETRSQAVQVSSLEAQISPHEHDARLIRERRISKGRAELAPSRLPPPASPKLAGIQQHRRVSPLKMQMPFRRASPSGGSPTISSPAVTHPAARPQVYNQTPMETPEFSSPPMAMVRTPSASSSSQGPISPAEGQPISGVASMPARKPTGRVWDPARGVDVFKRGSEEVLARFLRMGGWEEDAQARGQDRVSR